MKAKRYHELKDGYAEVRHSGLDVSRSEFYANGAERIIDLLLARTAELGENYVTWATATLSCEAAWGVCGSPYYKIGGHYLEAATRTRLDVPCDAMRLPFPTMLVRLQEGHGLILYGGELRTILATEADGGLQIYATFEVDDALEAPNGALAFSVRLDKGGSLEDAIERSIGRYKAIEGGNLTHESETEMNDLSRQCLKVLATVALLAIGNNDLLEPDVLSRDRAKMAGSVGEARSRIAERARRRGKVGWTVGETRLPRSANGATAPGRPGGRELDNSHLRCGHFHAVRHGRGWTEVKVLWFPPTVVRPDLPAAESRGYVTA